MAAKGFVRLPADELNLLQLVRQSEIFRHTAWTQYGKAWDQHVPQDINAFVHYYFGTILFPWHLSVFYSPVEISEITIVGARGCLHPDTLIDNAITGEKVPVQQIKGMFPVWSQAPGLNLFATVFIERPIEYPEADYLKFTLLDGKSVTVTPEHRFLTPFYGWKSASDLHPGMDIGIWQKAFVPIRSIEHVGRGPYYDFTVPQYHNYLAQGIWHHNCAKTEGLAIAWATYRALHPGADHLHVAPTKDQANRTVDAILKWGVNGFNKTFIEDVVRQPFPEIRFKRWDEEDQGARLLVRSLGDEDIERLRSHSADILSGDEFFREVETADTAAQLRGCIRGVNQYALKKAPKDVQGKYHGLIRGITLTLRPEKRQEYRDELEALIHTHGLGIRGLMCLYGNAGFPDWAWDRYDQAERDPRHYWSIRVKSKDNPLFTQKDLDALARSFGDNDELREVEMEGKRPMNLGSEFPGHMIKGCTDEDLLKEADELQARNVPGFVVARHSQAGVYLYQVPPIPEHRHAIGCDPGTGLMPGRNKFTIVVFDISETPCRLVYFEMGYLSPKQTGHYHGFMARLKWAVQYYPTSPEDVVVESTGTQKGMTELSWPEDLPVTAVDFTSQKFTLLNYLKQLMGIYRVRWPHIERILQELGNYTLPDTDISQDVVMAMICAALSLWKYHGFKITPEDQSKRPRPPKPSRHARTPGSRSWARRS